MPAEKAVELIDQRLKDFGIVRETDVIASTTDGASMMRKFGRLLGCEHQQCHAHGLHLAVVDTLYQKPSVTSILGSNRGDNEEELEVEEEEEEGEEEECDGEAFDQGDSFDETRSQVPPFTPSVGEIGNKVRRVWDLPTRSWNSSSSS